jgi:DNA-directed RNA polymerase subunit E'/Rpb7
MQHAAIFEEQVALTPKDMRQDIESIDTVLLEKLSTTMEGRCSKNGYVLPGTVQILSRSMGAMEKGRFTGNILFHLQAEATVLNPSDGTILEGEVIRKNKMGMYVSYMEAIRVIIPRDLYIGDEGYDAVQIGDRIQVEIKKSRFQVNDPYILSIGYFKGLAAKIPRNSVQESKAGAEEEKEVEDEEAEAEEDEEEEAEEAAESEGLHEEL